MSADAPQPPAVTPLPESSSDPDRHRQVRLKSEGGRLLLTLPAEAASETTPAPLPTTWTELWQQLKQRLTGGDRFWQPNTTVHLIARDRLLDSRQLQAIADALAEVQLQLKRVYTSRRQTAVAAATAGYSVEQQSAIAHLTQSPDDSAAKVLDEPLYLQTTLRSGAEVRHPGTVIICGDINPGSSVVADGDILIWGRLRGIAHAGAAGNTRCRIMALQMEPTQIRIADYVARAPENPPAQYYPEVAYVTPDGIRIAQAADFLKQQQPRA
ncbi:septum site-determining protein MinC [Geitlerinema sp. PCC 7407]|uniref:septum site-determining protein MinC n=1 Tax=Geitlerinema sp. PCC 7407 TaxID=1173025 RepID=UPI00029F9855|nr:septum site-determining protein MinC [Geitlerinema sp. PCC 7407]AFY67947.1 septum site-determining protein MinC [Geitlerinema sp. PCC 7407]